MCRHRGTSRHADKLHERLLVRTLIRPGLSRLGFLGWFSKLEFMRAMDTMSTLTAMPSREVDERMDSRTYVFSCCMNREDASEYIMEIR